jgi:medium-chain acyl-[acyl-carrier-protein] hydrolase
MTALTKWFPFGSIAPGARTRLFCFPHAGGTASTYQRWLKILSPDVDVRPVEFPGHGTRLAEPLLLDAHVLVKEFTRAILPLLDRPFALFGHSLGAIVAFEAARELRRIGAPSPMCLLVSGSAAPGNEPIFTPFSQLSDQDFVKRLKQFHLSPPVVYECSELMELTLPSIRADVALGERYVHSAEPRLKVPITAFAASDDSVVMAERVRDWKAHTDSVFEFYLFPGDHFFLSSSESSVLPIVWKTLSKTVQPLS